MSSSDGAEHDDDDHHVDEDEDDGQDLHLSKVDHRQMAIGHLSSVRQSEIGTLETYDG